MAKKAAKKKNSLNNKEVTPLPVEQDNKNFLVENLNTDCSAVEEALRFPVSSFPLPLQEIILQNQKCLLFPPSYMGTSILYTASVAIGNTHWVRIKKGFEVPVVLYCALVGKVGVTKSHPLKFAINNIFA